MELPWLHWWDSQGNLLLNSKERVEQKNQKAEQEKQKSDRLDRLIAQLRALAVEPEIEQNLVMGKKDKFCAEVEDIFPHIVYIDARITDYRCSYGKQT